MPIPTNIRGKTSIFDRVKDQLTSDATLATYLKAVYINVIEMFPMIPDVQTPAIVLNDNSETVESLSPVPNLTNDEEIKKRVYGISLYAVVKYAEYEDIVTGNSAFIGLEDFSHLVEAAINSDKTLDNTYLTMLHTGWNAVSIVNPEAPQIVFAISRRMDLTYIGKPEAI